MQKLELQLIDKSTVKSFDVKNINDVIYNTKKNHVCSYVRLSLEISITTETIGFYSSANILTGPVVILCYFNPSKNNIGSC